MRHVRGAGHRSGPLLEILVEGELGIGIGQFARNSKHVLCWRLLDHSRNFLIDSLVLGCTL